MLEWLNLPVKQLDRKMETAALARQAQLTKPPGSLGQLEALAVRLSAMQGVERPAVDHAAIVIFAGTMVWRNVSVFPQAVTGEMVKILRAAAIACWQRPVRVWRWSAR